MLAVSSTGQGARAAVVREVRVSSLALAGTLNIPRDSGALVIFAHGSGSSRLSPRNVAVAKALNRRGIATLLFDLLTLAEESERSNVFDVPLLAERLIDTVNWVGQDRALRDIRIGMFGASTGAAAAWWRRPSLAVALVRSFRAEAGRTSQAPHSTKSARPRF